MINLVNFFKGIQFSKDNLYEEVIKKMDDYIMICTDSGLREYIIENELWDFQRCLILFSIVDEKGLSLFDHLLSKTQIEDIVEIDYELFKLTREEILNLIIITVIHHLNKSLSNIIKYKLLSMNCRIRRGIFDQYKMNGELNLSESENIFLKEIDSIELRDGELVILITFVKEFNTIHLKECKSDYSDVYSTSENEEFYTEFKILTKIKKII
jgi:hypothetical protein